MKKQIVLMTLFIGLSASASAFASSSVAGSASETNPPQDLRSSSDFVATCPEQYLTYIDKSEGGPGAYCACPDENITYIDKSEGGPGFYCAP